MRPNFAPFIAQKASATSAGAGVMRLILKLILAITLCGPAFATTTGDALRELVMAGDLAAVEATIDKAVKQDFATRADPASQRDLFPIFQVTHPDIGTFTEKWLHDMPTSAYAMTARAWYLYDLGFANRGYDTMRFTFSGGLDLMHEQHEEALSLFSAATKANPQLLAASDGIFAVSRTIAGKGVIPAELERIMVLYPTRGSLMRVMFSISPQWGGSRDQVNLICDRYAPLIVSIKDYRPEVCVVDAVFYADFRDEQARHSAYLALQEMDQPILDDARLGAAMDGRGPVTQRLAVFEKVKAKRPLTPEEVSRWRPAFDQANNLPPTYDDPVYAKAVADNIDQLRIAADQDPLNSKTVIEYINQVGQNSSANNLAYDQADVEQRLQTLLRGIPHSWRGWQQYAFLETFGQKFNLEKAAPMYQNSIFYSNYSRDAVQEALQYISYMSFRQRALVAEAPNRNVAAPQSASLDRLGLCPMIALERLATELCRMENKSVGECFRSDDNRNNRDELKEDIKARGVCQTEMNAPLETLLKGPVAVDF
jgi:hypothetical protein